MRHNLLISLTLSALLAACADHRGGVLPAGDTPNVPITDGGTSPGGSSALDTAANATGDGDTPTAPEVVQVPATQPQPPQGPLDSTDGGVGGGGGGGQPVPEPGTLLLVGTGLAGVALLRRRRRTPGGDER